MAEKEKLTNNAIKILADLFRARRPLSIKKIASRNDIHWKTASDNIKRLESRKLVKCERTRMKTSCQVTKRTRRALGG